MIVAQLTPHIDAQGGGLSEVVRNLSRTLAAHGNQVSVYGRLNSGNLDNISVQGAQLHAAASGRDVARALSAQPIDLVHSHGLWDPYLTIALHVPRSNGVPTVISPHGMLDSWALRQGRIKKWLALATYEGRNLGKARCVHALTRSEAEAIHRFVPEASVAVIPNGISLPRAFRRGESTEKVLIYLGRIHPKKGIVNLVTAFERVANNPEAKDWRLEIAGWDDGGHLAEVQQCIVALGLADRVSYVGPVFGADKQRLLARSNAFALTSFSEGLPMSVLEAWSFGHPVLITPQCNLTESEAEGAALLCEANVSSIASGLRKLFGMSTESRSTMGNNGRHLVATRYSWERIAGLYEDLYAWLVGIGGRPSFVSFGRKGQ
jgi:poly(glycerol-phosphate) alpha-glucosyltransferase